MEWVSKVSVKPTKKEVYSSGVRAMMENGVKVLFITKNVFADFKNLMERQETEKAFDLLFSCKPLH